MISGWLRLWTMSFETLAASGYVIARRSMMIGNAAFSPETAMREVIRMGPEKLDAFTRGMNGAVRACDPLDAAVKSLAPVHKRATANARRLGRKS